MVEVHVKIWNMLKMIVYSQKFRLGQCNFFKFFSQRNRRIRRCCPCPFKQLIVDLKKWHTHAHPRPRGFETSCVSQLSTNLRLPYPYTFFCHYFLFSISDERRSWYHPIKSKYPLTQIQFKWKWNKLISNFFLICNDKIILN